MRSGGPWSGKIKRELFFAGPGSFISKVVSRKFLLLQVLQISFRKHSFLIFIRSAEIMQFRFFDRNFKNMAEFPAQVFFFNVILQVYRVRPIFKRIFNRHILEFREEIVFHSEFVEIRIKARSYDIFAFGFHCSNASLVVRIEQYSSSSSMVLSSSASLSGKTARQASLSNTTLYPASLAEITVALTQKSVANPQT